MAALEGKPLLLRAKIVDTVDTPTAKMPVGFQYFYYAGRDPKTEREIVWQSPTTKHFCVGAPGCPPNDEFVAAYALAAMDAYYVDGEPWRTLYKSAPDAASRLALGKAVAKRLTRSPLKRKPAVSRTSRGSANALRSVRVATSPMTLCAPPG